MTLPTACQFHAEWQSVDTCYHCRRESHRDAALFAAFVHALRTELLATGYDGFAKEWMHLHDEVLTSLDHWRTQAAAMAQARDQAQAAELRAMKVVERLTTELQAARMPDDVKRTIGSWFQLACMGAVDADDDRALAWLDGLDARKDVK